MSILKHDGATTSAYWEARLNDPASWDEYIKLPLIRALDIATQQQIWKLLGRDVKTVPSTCLEGR